MTSVDASNVRVLRAPSHNAGNFVLHVLIKCSPVCLTSTCKMSAHTIHVLYMPAYWYVCSLNVLTLWGACRAPKQTGWALGRLVSQAFPHTSAPACFNASGRCPNQPRHSPQSWDLNHCISHVLSQSFSITNDLSEYIMIPTKAKDFCDSPCLEQRMVNINSYPWQKKTNKQ